jgi:PAN domain
MLLIVYQAHQKQPSICLKNSVAAETVTNSKTGTTPFYACSAADVEECSKYCKDTTGCYCSYFSPSRGICTLYSEEGGACFNIPDDPDALAYSSKPGSHNNVTVLCGGGDHLDPTYYYDY